MWLPELHALRLLPINIYILSIDEVTRTVREE